MTATNRLVKGMYEQRSRLYAGKLFDLRRFEPDDFVHNAGWYNANGERLGYGDLSKEGIARIAEGLEEGELFVVLPEQDIVWTKNERHPDPMSLDLQYICEHVRLIIGPKRVLWVERGEIKTRFIRDGVLTIEVISAEDAYKGDHSVRWSCVIARRGERNRPVLFFFLPKFSNDRKFWKGAIKLPQKSPGGIDVNFTNSSRHPEVDAGGSS